MGLSGSETFMRNATYIFCRQIHVFCETAFLLHTQQVFVLQEERGGKFNRTVWLLCVACVAIIKWVVIV